MYSTQIYYYEQRQQVVLLSGTSNRSYTIVYAKNLSVSKGVDNVIQFQFVNQEQKYVNVDNKDITARIIDGTGTVTLLQKTLTPIYPITGLMSLQLTVADLEGIDPQKCYYSLEVPTGSLNYPAFVDYNGASRGMMSIVDSVLPTFAPARTVTVPSHAWPVSGSGNGVTYSSSIINTPEQAVASIQTYYTTFTGNTKLQGSVLADFSVSYPITESVDYANFSGTVGQTITGYHPYVRMEIVNMGTIGTLPPNVEVGTSSSLGGDVTSILYR